MKKGLIFGISAILLTAISCKKYEDKVTPPMDYKANTSIYAVVDTSGLLSIPAKVSIEAEKQPTEAMLLKIKDGEVDISTIKGAWQGGGSYKVGFDNSWNIDGYQIKSGTFTAFNQLDVVLELNDSVNFLVEFNVVN